MLEELKLTLRFVRALSRLYRRKLTRPTSQFTPEQVDEYSSTLLENIRFNQAKNGVL